jgi:hypoxanthine phosphoribosyltransferase
VSRRRVPDSGGAPAAIRQALDDAELLFDCEAIDYAVDQLAVRLSVALYESNPILLCVMNGGVSLTGDLLRRLHFPLQLDFVHATRYANSTTGREIEWHTKPQLECQGRTVLVVDDILDEGVTLAAIVDDVRARGAAHVKTAVLVRKRIPRVQSIDADFVALECPDRYVFGRGMDYLGYWRNLADIYALPEPR